MMQQRLTQLGLWLGALTMGLPFGLLIVTSLMTPQQTLAYPPTWIPNPVAWENYPAALAAAPLWHYFWISLLVAAATSCGQIVTGAMAGYAFARLSFPGRDLLFGLVLLTLVVPVPVNVIPLFGMIVKLGWLDTPLALIVPGLVGGIGTFMLRQWYLGLPRELEEAALIDGCTPWTIFWRIAFPLARPALASLGLITFVASWNSFFWPLVATHSELWRTLPVGLSSLRSSFREVTNWGVLMAATAIAVAPAVAVFLAGQRFLVQGLTAGGSKE
jgi:multiple sugar transport system permease protein